MTRSLTYLALLAVATVALALSGCGESTPTAAKDKAAGSTDALALEPKEVRLTEADVRRYMAHAKEEIEVRRPYTAMKPGQIDEFMANLKAVQKKHGFDTADGYSISWTIASIFGGIDHQGSKRYVSRQDRLKKQLADIRGSPYMDADSKKAAAQAIEDELAEIAAGKGQPEPRMPENIALVERFAPEILAVIVGGK
ncbi:MAG TPA: hypothetical protein PK264_11745 [Hyphomicrobiaceae bacterium]|nr:hypothetical protein [Hyphomicrobiaceae bacterium]